MKKRDKNIFVRATEGEKNQIYRSAKSCGLSMSEYLRKRALGYSPRATLPDTFYDFYSKLCDLHNFIDGKAHPAARPANAVCERVSTDVEEKLLCLIDDIRSVLLLPGKKTISQIKAGLGRTMKNGNHRILANQRKTERCD